MKKRLLAGILSLAMCLSLTSVSAFAETEVSQEIPAEAAQVSETDFPETVTELSEEEQDSAADLPEAAAEASEEEIETVVEESVTETPGNATNHSQAEAVAWALARANEGWLVDYDGSGSVQCVDLIVAYYDYLLGWHVSGNAIDYSWNTLPSGWTRVYSNPQPGDVVVWNKGATMGWDPYYGFNTYADSNYGHIGVVTAINGDGTYQTVETNSDYKRDPYWGYDPKAKAKLQTARYTGGVACYIRPDFVKLPYYNFGKQYVYTQITRMGTNQNLEAHFGQSEYGYYTIGGATENKVTADQCWMFFDVGNNEYVIEDMTTCWILTTEGEYIRYREWLSTPDEVRWYVLNYGDHFEIAPKTNPARRLAIGRGGMTPISIVMCIDRKGGEDEHFQITELDIDPPRRQLKSSNGTFVSDPIGMSMADTSPLDGGEQRQIHASLINYDHEATTQNECIWTSSNPEVATVDSNGVVTGVSNGTATIRATSVFCPHYDGVITVTVEVQKPKELVITGQPENISAGVNGMAAFTVTAENAASYQWQYSKNGGAKWVNCSATGNTTDSISLKVTTSNSVNIYRCVVTGTDGKQLISDTAGVDLLPGAVITLNPKSNAVAVGEYATFTVETENAAGFQWQYSKDGAHWYRSNAEGNQTDTLIVKGEQKSQGNRYRCVVTGIDGNTKKSYMAAMIVMTVAPKDCTAAVGQMASYTLKAEGIATYQWQYSKDGGQTWYKSSAEGATTDTVTFKASSSNRAMIYRCKLTTPDEATAYTKPVGFK